MPLNYYMFKTGGDWDSTTLYNNADEVPADELYIELNAGRDDNGNPTRGGISAGGSITAYVSPQNSNGQQVSIFPGKIELEFPLHKIVIKNESPVMDFEFTSIMLDDQDITGQVVDFVVKIDAVNNEVQSYVIMYKHHLFGSDEVANINLL